MSEPFIVPKYFPGNPSRVAVVGDDAPPDRLLSGVQVVDNAEHGVRAALRMLEELDALEKCFETMQTMPVPPTEPYYSFHHGLYWALYGWCMAKRKK